MPNVMLPQIELQDKTGEPALSLTDYFTEGKAPFLQSLNQSMARRSIFAVK